jgi:oxygen-independent coproporphyrinogen III oxidase
MMITNNISDLTKRIGLYVHIPFCQRKCRYCGFLSIENPDEKIVLQYLDILQKESQYHIKSATNLGFQYVVDTVFIGGGTPSLLTNDEIDTLMNGLREHFIISPDAEITIESNPNSITKKKLIAYKENGINRLSIGVQSFEDSILQQLGRLHDAKMAKDAIQDAHDAGFSNINIDLMFGLPYITLEQWMSTLKTAVSLNPSHLSLYSLQIEEGTPFYSDYKNDRLPIIDIALDRECYHQSISFLKNHQIEQYEISNFSIQGRKCKHNLKYWGLEEFIGLGLGAASYINGKRWSNLSNLENWKREILAGRTPADPTTIIAETKQDAMSVFFFTGLRKAEGISFPQLDRIFGANSIQNFQSSFPALEEYIQKEYIIWDRAGIRLTENGIDHSNEIMAEFVS